MKLNASCNSGDDGHLMCNRKRANLGYAFVNFTSSLAAERFRREFENFSWDNIGFRKKICEITVAKYQVCVLLILWLAIVVVI